MNREDRRDSLMLRYELFTAAATLAAHAIEPEGFRQREVKFFAELFSNWMDVTINSSVFTIQNTQILRYLDRLVAEGLAVRKARSRPPKYSLRPAGIVDLLRRLTLTDSWPHQGHFFFVYFFLSSYRSQLAALAEHPAKLAPTIVSELHQLIDPEALKRRYIKVSKRKLADLQERITSAQSSSQEVLDLLKQGSNPSDAIAYVEQHHPYQLNNQKPLSELMSSLSPERATWELTHGSLRRANLMWQPLEGLLMQFIEVLENL